MKRIQQQRHRPQRPLRRRAWKVQASDWTSASTSVRRRTIRSVSHCPYLHFRSKQEALIRRRHRLPRRRRRCRRTSTPTSTAETTASDRLMEAVPIRRLHHPMATEPIRNSRHQTLVVPAWVTTVATVENTAVSVVTRASLADWWVRRSCPAWVRPLRPDFGRHRRRAVAVAALNQDTIRYRPIHRRVPVSNVDLSQDRIISVRVWQRHRLLARGPVRHPISFYRESSTLTNHRHLRPFLRPGRAEAADHPVRPIPLAIWVRLHPDCGIAAVRPLIWLAEVLEGLEGAQVVARATMEATEAAEWPAVRSVTDWILLLPRFLSRPDRRGPVWELQHHRSAAKAWIITATV